MTQQVINVGAAINDGTGDPARVAFTKSNDNFTELYQRAPQCGVLAYVSTTALSFTPYNGDRIKIGGTVYAIPSAGIAGLTNGGLSANTLYYVYAYNNSGTITGEFSTTTHATSSTADNIGVEIKSGDNTRTLIGMVRTNASAQFQNIASARLVLSWFNRRNIGIVGASSAGATTGSTTFVEIATVSMVTFLTWGNEAVSAALTGSASNGPGAYSVANIGLDSTTTGASAVNVLGTSAASGYFVDVSMFFALTPAEGYHFMMPIGYTSAGGGATFYVGAVAMIRG